MSGPQFFHLQSFSRKSNRVGQHVDQVLAEAARDPAFSQHVSAIREPRVVFGISPAEVKGRHDKMVAEGRVSAKMADGTSRLRNIRKDRHTLMTCVASHPFLTHQIESDPEARRKYDDWVEYNLAFFRQMFGDKLVGVVEHLDEEHPHLHGFILPEDDLSCSARDLNPAWAAKNKAEASAREVGHGAKAAVGIGNLAYKARARELQDLYYKEVGIASALTRTGPKRERLSRGQWKARKAAAERDAQLLHDMERRVETLASQEAEIEISSEEIAAQLTGQLEQITTREEESKRRIASAQFEAKRLVRETRRQKEKAAAELVAAEEMAQKIVKQARDKVKYDQAVSDAYLRDVNRQVREARQEAVQERKEVQAQADAIRREGAREAFELAYRLAIGIFTGEVVAAPDKHGWHIHGERLKRRADALELSPFIDRLLTAVSRIWDMVRHHMKPAVFTTEIAEIIEDRSSHDQSASKNLNRGVEP